MIFSVLGNRLSLRSVLSTADHLLGFASGLYSPMIPYSGVALLFYNRPFSYSTKEPGSSDIFIQFHTIHEVRKSCVRASIAIINIRKFYKL